MTHEELTIRIIKLSEKNDENWKFYPALRAVVELHRPQPTTIPSDPKCDACSGLDWADYPCPTIQAIEKELE